MSKLIWGDSGERFYETGINQGVLYVDGIGVPWNGLISVQESPSGGSPTPYYLDGVKYLNVATVEEFEATLEAFSSPRQFDTCDGTSSVGNGLFITQQPRKPFGLSYRTRIGNDIDGLEHGYKIHLVYDALAAPTERGNSSLGETAEPMHLSWSITTTPKFIPGMHPAAHLVIDSTEADPNLLNLLEGFLYGGLELEPRQPTPSQIVGIFGTWSSDGLESPLRFLGVHSNSTPLPTDARPGDAYVITNVLWVFNQGTWKNFYTVDL